MAVETQNLRIEIEVTEQSPPTGWLRAGGARRQFGGWLELIAELDSILGREDVASVAADRKQRGTEGT